MKLNYFKEKLFAAPISDLYFFVGTIGLLELFETHSQIPYLSHKSESKP